ncbi:MAG TPA: hypothetical protein VEY33_07680 [Gemmatimonadota bacterium]|nr:hypothetical protein [Gemmatimonadota bacterium]
MSPRTLTMVRRPPMLRGVPPRYQVFDRRERPPITVSVFYVDPDRDAVVFEVYEDGFREFLKRSPGLGGKRFDWMLDVDPDAPGDTISEIVRPGPMPIPERRGGEDAPRLTLEEAVEAMKADPFYRVIKTSDPV